MGRSLETDEDFFRAALAGGTDAGGEDGRRVVSFEQVGSDEVWHGRIASVRVEQFRHDDGEVVTRECIGHPGAVVMLPFDGERIWLVRQPREVVGEQNLLKLPAGKLDVEGEEILETAKRELREEIGMSAATWHALTSFYASPGFTDEEIHAFLATDLRDDPAKAEESGGSRSYPSRSLDSTR